MSAATRDPARGALPNLVVIGAMKCGTTALHDLLARHPQIAMSRPKELNFFFGPTEATVRWSAGNWPRGLDWYTSHFDADVPLRGESSPGYTSPDHPEVAQRMAATIPGARLVYLVRDPIARALSQYDHHRADGAERRGLTEALTDPASQYLSRGRYHERLMPFLSHFDRGQIMVVAQEDLRDDRAATLRRVLGFLGADPSLWRAPAAPPPSGAGDRVAALDPRLRARLAGALHDDAERLRAFTGQPLAAWSV
jgi:hypothetical protein